jgi:PRTRC genetic system ThiF family protein
MPSEVTMIELTINPVLPYVLPAETPIVVALVGCGGTGSHLAQSLARLASHVRDTGGPTLALTFVDGDTVEPKNIGRQLFSAADVGKNKAQALAARFSSVFGLRITAIPSMLDAGDLMTLPPNVLGVLVGAVDGADGRQAIARHLGAHNWRLWLDCGNHESSGQVCVGGAPVLNDLRHTLRAGLCARLPAPHILYPELLKPAPKRRRADCAAAMQDNAQSLMVNQTMAAIASQYAYQLVVRRRLTTFRTVVDLDTLTMRSDPITARALAAATGMAEDELLAPAPAKKTARRRAA